MASVFLNETKRLAAQNWLSARTSLRMRLVMTNTTCDTENDAIQQLADYTTIDPSDATGYADVVLAGSAVAVDDANDRAEFDANDVVFSGLSGNATRDYQGVVLYDRIDGTNANDLAQVFIDFTADITKFATSVTVPWNAEGILQLA